MKKFFKPYFILILIIFSARLFSQQYTALHQFVNDGTDGNYPITNPVLIDNVLYGFTGSGGTNGTGTFFKVNTDGSDYTIIKNFGDDPLNTGRPIGTLLVVNDRIYCATYSYFFSISTDGTDYKAIHEFTWLPGDVFGDICFLIQDGDFIYGIMNQSGPGNNGGIFKYDIGNDVYSVQYFFTGGTDGCHEPYGQGVISNNILYGTTFGGGAYGVGTLYSLDLSNNDFTLLHSFDGGDNGARPYSGIVLDNDHIYGTTYWGGVSMWGDGYGVLFDYNLGNNEFSIIHNFWSSYEDGIYPDGALMIVGGRLYGLTVSGGAGQGGCIYSIKTDGSDMRLEHSFDWYTEKYPDANYMVQSGKYLYGCIKNGAYDVLGAVFSLDMERAPRVTTDNINDVLIESAACSANVTDDGGVTVTARGICWNTSGSPTLSDNFTIEYGTTGNFSSYLTGLTGNTVYYVRSYATNGIGTTYGNELNFVTNNYPDTQTWDIEDITYSTATAMGYIGSDGGLEIIARGFCWNTTGDPTLSDNFSTESGTSGDLTSSITSLAYGTHYYIRSYVTNSGGTFYGNTLEFDTPPVYLPTVNFFDYFSVTGNSANVIGFLASDGGAPILEEGVCWNTTGNPSISDNKSAGTGNGFFWSNMTGLTPGTTYYFRNYATNIAGTAYSDEISLTALDFPTVLTYDVSDISSTSAIGYGEITSDGGNVITARGFCCNTTGNPTRSDNSYAILDNSNPFSRDLNTLQPNTKYYVRAWAENSVGTAYGDEVSFTTVTNIPTVLTLYIFDIETSTAVCVGDVTSDGGDAITARGICWNTTGSPSLTDNFTFEYGYVSIFTSKLTGLTPGIVYHIRAYATNSLGTAYGDDVTFTINCDNNITNGLLAYYPFNGNANDASGNGYNGNVNGATLTTDRFGRANSAYSFNGIDNNIVLANTSGLNMFSGFSIVAWVNFTDNSGGHSIVSKHDNYYQNSFCLAASGNQAALSTNDDAYLVASNETYNDGNWHMVVGMFYDNFSTIYVDGNFKATAKVAYNIGNTQNIKIGSDSRISFYNGLIDDVRIYDHPLNYCEIQELYNYTPAEAPTVTTNTIYDISAHSVVAGGDVTSDGGSTITARGICWNTSGTPTIADNITTEGGTTGVFTSTITGLNPNTTYYIRAYATNGIGTSYGDEYNATTPNVPSVTTNDVTDIHNNDAKGHATINNDGGMTITATGFCWNTTGSPTLADNFNMATGNGFTFSGSLTSLNPGTIYYVRAFAINEVGIAYGEDATFRTASNNYPTTQASNLEFSNVTQTAATISWKNGNGDKRILLRKTSDFTDSDNPVDSKSYSTGNTIGGAIVVGIYNGSTTTATFSNLSNNTAYYYKLFEYNESSDPKSPFYKTDGFGSSNPNTFKTAPNQINNLLVKTYTKIYVDLEWQRGNGDACMMTCLKGATSDLVNPVYGMTNYTADANYASGDRLGSGTPENYVVYKGTGTACRVSGLSRNTQYSFKVFEYNLYNSYYSYAINNSSGNPRSRTTIPKEGEGGDWVDLDNGRIINFKLSPIPANEVLNLALTLEDAANITVELFNMGGQNVGTQNVGTHCNVSLPANSLYQKGQYEIPIAIDKLATGSYYIIVSGNNEVVVQDFVIVR